MFNSISTTGLPKRLLPMHGHHTAESSKSTTTSQSPQTSKSSNFLHRCPNETLSHIATSFAGNPWRSQQNLARLSRVDQRLHNIVTTSRLSRPYFRDLSLYDQLLSTWEDGVAKPGLTEVTFDFFPKDPSNWRTLISVLTATAPKGGKRSLNVNLGEHLLDEIPSDETTEEMGADFEKLKELLTTVKIGRLTYHHSNRHDELLSILLFHLQSQPSQTSETDVSLEELPEATEEAMDQLPNIEIDQCVIILQDITLDPGSHSAEEGRFEEVIDWGDLYIFGEPTEVTVVFGSNKTWNGAGLFENFREYPSVQRWVLANRNGNEETSFRDVTRLSEARKRELWSRTCRRLRNKGKNQEDHSGLGTEQSRGETWNERLSTEFASWRAEKGLDPDVSVKFINASDIGY